MSRGRKKSNTKTSISNSRSVSLSKGAHPQINSNFNLRVHTYINRYFCMQCTSHPFAWLNKPPLNGVRVEIVIRIFGENYFRYGEKVTKTQKHLLFSKIIIYNFRENYIFGFWCKSKGLNERNSDQFIMQSDNARISYRMATPFIGPLRAHTEFVCQKQGFLFLKFCKFSLWPNLKQHRSLNQVF